MYNTQNGICVIHDCGFFSCFSQRLGQIIKYANLNREFPPYVDSSKQFSIFKLNNNFLDISYEFLNINLSIPKYINAINFTDQFTDYKKLNFNLLNPIIAIYFQPSRRVVNTIKYFEKQYNLNYENTCAIFYRGNDKHYECTIANYEDYIKQALKIQSDNMNINFFIQTDDSLFIKFCIDNLKNIFYIREMPTIHDSSSAVVYTLPTEQRIEHGVKFLAATNIVAKCKFLITHSGNCGYWASLYRGKSDGIIQCFTDETKQPTKWI